MRSVVTGSIAYDYLMSFPGKFTEQLVEGHLQRVSLSFLVDTMDKRRGGCAPNIAYTLALLGEKPMLMGTAGQDFEEYRRWLEAASIDTSLVQIVPNKFTASFFCSTDEDNNQIASFYTGAMVQYAQECRTLGIKFIFDPGQQCARMSGEELAAGISGAFMVICNDYEFELIRQKTGKAEADVLAECELLVVTKGEKGCTIMRKGSTGAGEGQRSQIDVPAVEPRQIADPTGVGDAFRGGFMKGLAAGATDAVCGQLGSMAATYALEHLGGTSHSYTWKEFVKRYEMHFGPLNL